MNDQQFNPDTHWFRVNYNVSPEPILLSKTEKFGTIRSHWYHYSNVPYLDLTREYTQRFTSHPKGLWMSAEKGFGSWFGFRYKARTNEFEYKHVLEVKLDNLLIIETYAECEKLAERYGTADISSITGRKVHDGGFHWEEIAKKYSGIYIPFELINNECIYEWDVESLVIWDLSQVISCESASSGLDTTQRHDPDYFRVTPY